MPIVFYCPECGQKLRIGDEFAGQAAECVRCSSQLRVPEKSEAKSRRDEPQAPPPSAPPRKLFGLPGFQRGTAPPAAQVEPPETAGSQPRETARFSEPETKRIEPPQPEPAEIPQSETGAPLAPAPREPLPSEQPSIDEPDTPSDAPSELTAGSAEAGLSMPTTPGRPVRRVSKAAPARRGQSAPLMKPSRKIDIEDLIDMTSMVDVVFFLLIFFLVTSMKALDSSIPMPSPDQKKASSGQPKALSDIDADEGQIVVRIDRNDTIFVEGAEVHNERDLVFKLRDLKLGAGRPEKLLVIGHGDASHGTAVMVLDAGRDVGLEQVRLAVADENE